MWIEIDEHCIQNLAHYDEITVIETDICAWKYNPLTDEGEDRKTILFLCGSEEEAEAIFEWIKAALKAVRTDGEEAGR